MKSSTIAKLITANLNSPSRLQRIWDIIDRQDNCDELFRVFSDTLSRLTSTKPVFVCMLIHHARSITSP